MLFLFFYQHLTTEERLLRGLSEFLINPPNPSFWTRGEIVGCTKTHLHIGHMNLPRSLFLLQTLMGGGGDFLVYAPYIKYFVGPTDKGE